MKKNTVKLLSVLILAFFVTSPFTQNIATAQESYAEKTLADIGNPVVAGPGLSSFDEGALYYETSGNTVGFNFDMSDALVSADYVFSQLSWPSWFSITLKASGVDRTQSPNLEQKGYSFVFFPAGSCEILKGGATLVSKQMAPILTSKKYNIKVGALNTGSAVNLLLFVDGEKLIDFSDNQNAYTEGSWFNYCGDGAVTAQITSTKRIENKPYYTHTLNNLGRYPTVAGVGTSPKVDESNNIETFDSSNSLGFNLHLKDYSFEAKYNFKSFGQPGWFGIAMRASSFGRVMEEGMLSQGYSFLFFKHGVVQIYKHGVGLLLSQSIPAFEENKDYIIEVGTIDLKIGATQLIVSVDKVSYVDYNDTDKPIQTAGFLNVCADGQISFKATSIDTKVTPTKVELSDENNSTKVRIYFVNSFSLTNMSHANFSEMNLRAIYINGVSVYDANNTYKAADGGRAVDLKFVSNFLELTICKKLVDQTGGAVTLNLQNIEIKKTKPNGGIRPPSGLTLKQSFFHILSN